MTVMKLFIQHMCPPDEAELANVYKHITPLWRVSTFSCDVKCRQMLHARKIHRLDRDVHFDENLSFVVSF